MFKSESLPWLEEYKWVGSGVVGWVGTQDSVSAPVPLGLIELIGTWLGLGWGQGLTIEEIT